MSRPLLLSSIIFLLIIGAAFFFFSDYERYLRVQLLLFPPTEYVFEWTPPDATTAGLHSLTIEATDPLGHTASKDVLVNVAAPRTPKSSPPVTSAPATFMFYPHQGHHISGEFSGIERDGNRIVATLAHSRAVLQRNVSLPRHDYWLDIHAKHDRPGPVEVAVYVDGRVWKIIHLDKNDNQYRTHRLGLLRGFQEGNVRFQFLNDAYDLANPANPDTTRNFHMEWWRLTNQDGIAVEQALARPTRSDGWLVLPHLNQVIREVLGEQFVTPDIWNYYADRLTAPTLYYESIQTRGRLVSVMRYWQVQSPERPRGLTRQEQLARQRGAGGAGGLVVLPRLNQVIREELGNQFVTPVMWRYYAARVTLPATRIESITTELRLREVMRYWRVARPHLPRGEDVF